MKAFRILSMLLATMALWSCSNNDEVTSEDTPTKEYMVSIGFKGEITISEAPLSRTSGNDLYGIQVYSCPTTDNTDNYTAYAYGLFDDLSQMTIKLIDGYKYKFVSTMVKDGKEKIESYDNAYSLPFTKDGNVVLNIYNSFTYSSNNYLWHIDSGTSNMVDSPNYNHPNLNRYYGEHTGYTPTENGNVSINMLRTVFGLKVIANNLTDGTLNIAMAEAPEMSITHPTTEVEDIFTFYYVSQAYSTTDYSETIATTFTWTKADGAVIPLGTHDITFKRNKQTIVTVEIDKAIDEVSSNQSLNLTLESGTMGAGNTYIIEGDKITNTTVTPETGN